MRRSLALAVFAALAMGEPAAATICDDLHIYMGIVSAKCYGLSQSGSAQANAEALWAAIDAQAKDSVYGQGTPTVRIPAGTYSINLCAYNSGGERLLPYFLRGNLEGDGPDTTVLNFVPPDSTCAGSAFTVAGYPDVAIRGLAIRRVSSVADTAGFAVGKSRSGSLVVDRVDASGWYGGIQADPGYPYKLTVSKTKIHDIRNQAMATGGHAGAVIRIIDSEFYDLTGGVGAGYGLYAHGPYAELVVSGCSYHDARVGLHRFGCDGSCADYEGATQISGNHFWGSLYLGMYLDGTYHSRPQVAANRFDNTWQGALTYQATGVITQADGTLITGNVFHTQTGIVGSGASYLAVTSNTFAIDPPTSETPGYVGYGITGCTGCVGWNVYGNTFAATVTSQIVHSYGMRNAAFTANTVALHGPGIILESGADDWEISANSWSGNDYDTAAVVFTEMAPNPTHVRVRGNAFNNMHWALDAGHVPGYTFEANTLGTENYGVRQAP